MSLGRKVRGVRRNLRGGVYSLNHGGESVLRARAVLYAVERRWKIRTKIASFGFSLNSSVVTVEQEARCVYKGWGRVPVVKYIWEVLV